MKWGDTLVCTENNFWSRINSIKTTFFFQLDLLPPYSLCLQGNNLIFTCGTQDLRQRVKKLSYIGGAKIYLKKILCYLILFQTISKCFPVWLLNCFCQLMNIFPKKSTLGNKISYLDSQHSQGVEICNTYFTSP